MELTLENGLLSGLKQAGHCTITVPSGRYRLQVVRTEETLIRPYPLELFFSSTTLTTFPLLLLTLAQRSHFLEAVWLVVI